MSELIYPLSRRQLLHAATLLPAQAIRSSAANSAVTVGLIGAGGRGMLDAGHLVEHTTAKMTAICDIVPEKIDAAKKRLNLPHAQAFSNYRELLASDVDAVLIATPVFLHPEHLEEAVKAGKHVYIEKPAGADVAGCKRVLAAGKAAEGKLNITFGFQQRYGPGYRKAHELVTTGKLGPLRLARSHWIKGEFGPTASQKVPQPTTHEEKLRGWKNWRETFGDYIVETYCHGVDVLNWFLGTHPLKATASGSQTVIVRGDQRDHCTAIFTYANGVQATLNGTQITPRFHRDVREIFYCGEAVVETAREYWKLQRSSTDILHEKEPHDITIDAIKEFISRVRDGRLENAATHAAESTLTAIMARTSMDVGREVTWAEVVG
jgi:myo-inositol 2-dehydrogenase / D-chiro-inositol 1-dehydrogenase